MKSTKQLIMEIQFNWKHFMLTIIIVYFTWENTVTSSNVETTYLEKLLIPGDAEVVTSKPSRIRDKIEHLKTTENNSVKSVAFNIYPSEDTDIILPMISVPDLWIIQKYIDYNFDCYYKIHVSNESNTDVLSLHMLNIMFSSPKDMYLLFSHFPRLHILDLRGPYKPSLRAWSNNEVTTIDFLMKVTNSLEGITTLEMLHFERFQGYGLSGNGIVNMTQLLWPLRNSKLKYLALKNQDITVITTGLHKFTSYLKVLDLSENNLFMHTENLEFVFELMLHPSIEVMKFEGANLAPVNSNFTLLSQGDIQSKRYTRSLDQNNFSFCMRRYNLFVSNLLNNHDDVCKVWNCALAIGEMPALLSNVSCDVVDLDNWFSRGFKFNEDCESGITMPLGGNLSEFIFTNVHFPFQASHPTKSSYHYKPSCLIRNSVRKIHITNSPTLSVFIDINRIFKDRRLLGLDNVEDVNFSGNLLMISNITFFLLNVKNVKFLSLNKNLFNMRDEFDICKVAKYLQRADFSDTSLTHIGEHFLHSCSNLTSLNFANNRIRNVDFSFHSKVLKFMNLSGNPIVNISQKFIKQVDLQSSVLKRKLNDPLEIDLSNIEFVCTCSNIEAVEWIKSHEDRNVKFIGYDHYKCRHDDKLELLKTFDFDKLDCSGINQTLMITFSNVGVALLTTLLIILYKYRFHLYIWYTRLVMLLRKNERNLTPPEYEAYICYGIKDRFWVHDAMVPQLQNKYGFRLFLPLRQIIGGAPIYETILESMNASRVIIIVMSEDAVQEDMFRFEVQHACLMQMSQQKKVVVIKLGSISRSLLTTDYLVQIFDARSYIRWPRSQRANVDDNGEDDPGITAGVNDNGSIFPMYVRPGDLDQEQQESRNAYKLMSSKQKAFWTKIAKQLYS